MAVTSQSATIDSQETVTTSPATHHRTSSLTTPVSRRNPPPMFSNQATVITSMSHLKAPWCRIVLTFVEVGRDYLQWHPKTWVTNQEVITIKGWWTRIPPCLRWGSLPRSHLQVECVNLLLNSPHMLMISRKMQAMVQRTIMIYTRTRMRMIIHLLPRKLLCRTALLEVVQRLTISVQLPKWTKTVPLRRCQTSTHLMI